MSCVDLHKAEKFHFPQIIFMLQPESVHKLLAKQSCKREMKIVDNLRFLNLIWCAHLFLSNEKTRKMSQKNTKNDMYFS